MTTSYLLSCTHCDLEPAELEAGRSMREGLFRPEPGYCAHCDQLVQLDVATPVKELSGAGDVYDDLPSGKEALIALALKLRRPPYCSTCGTRAKKLTIWETQEHKAKQGEAIRRPTCRRCGEAALKAVITRFVD